MDNIMKKLLDYLISTIVDMGNYLRFLLCLIRLFNFYYCRFVA